MTTDSPIYLTANQRLAVYLQQKHTEAQRVSGIQVWESVAYLPLSTWIINRYLENFPNKIVLTNLQEWGIWHRIISHSLSEHVQPEMALLSPYSLTDIAKKTWRLIKQWQIPLTILANTPTQETSLFYQWANRFIQQCQQYQCLDEATCIDEALVILSAIKTNKAQVITLVGFSAFVSPQIQRVLTVLAQKYTLVYFHAEAAPYPIIQRVVSENTQTEWQSMVQWVQQCCQIKPSCSIGCFIADVNATRTIIQRTFKKIAPDIPFNIAGGSPLSRFPLIATALAILDLNPESIELTQLSRLLNSPFIGGAEEELTARALLDVKLRQLAEPKLLWQTVLVEDKCPHWQAQCKQAHFLLKQMPRAQTLSKWIVFFSTVLEAMGWPGERAINSAEYQQLERWQKLLDELSQLDIVFDQALTYRQARSYLGHLAIKTEFQSQSLATSVQILGIQDAIDLRFDYVWVAGMTQEDWPRSPKPNPFIPLALQRQLHMPHANAEQELIYSEQLTHQFCQMATAVMFSYAAYKEDRLQSPSHLIKPFPEIQIKIPPHQDQPTSINHPLVYIKDEYEPLCQSDAIFPGGAQVFSYQSACPFKAFAYLRLQVFTLTAPSYAITLRERGAYIHTILERLWKILGNHSNLCHYNELALTQLITTTVNQVLNTVAKKRPMVFKSRLMALEQQRLVQQIQKWLILEKNRPPFEVISTEAVMKVTFAGLTFQIRIDRKDKLADGSYLIIDYKTGECNLNAWFGERPDDLQLPLYALTSNHWINGLAFAQLKSDKLQWIGLSDKAYGIEGIWPITARKDNMFSNWHDFYAKQSIILKQLAKEFQQGYATVDPKTSHTCVQCGLQKLCRVHAKQYKQACAEYK